MTQKRSFLLYFSLLAGFSSFAQSLQGVLLDKKTESPIVFGNVQIGEKYGVITNEEGEFTIQTNRFGETDSLKFSSLGFKSKTIAIKDFKEPTVYLEEKIDELESVYLVNKLKDPDEIMQRVVENKNKNYSIDYLNFQAFSRTSIANTPSDFTLHVNKADFTDKKAIKKFNAEIQAFTQRIKNKKSSMYLDNFSEFYAKNHTLKVNEVKTTKLVNRHQNTSLQSLQENVFRLLGNSLESRNTFKVNSGLLPVTDSLRFAQPEEAFAKMDTTFTDIKRHMQNTLKKSDLSVSETFDFINRPGKYNFKLVEVTGFQDEMVYVLEFEPKWLSGKYKGTLLVSADTFAIVKMEYQLDEGEVAKKTNYKLLLGIKFVQDVHQGIIIYQKSGESYFPKYIQSQTSNYLYFDRSFTFKENAARKERIKIKLDFGIETTIATKHEILVVDDRSITEEEYRSFSGSKKAPIEEIATYDPSIWESYNIIAPNEAIKEFEF